MGRTGSSTRRKSSKKKSLKGYRKKKSRRDKSKKLRHRDDSYCSSSDDESTSSSLNSFSSSEGEYKSKRARSLSRDEIKGSKKRSRRRSLSEDSSEGSSPVKKRKRSKKGKKIKKKKKKSSKRDAYVSLSSDSESCSTCKDEDSSSDELGSHGGSRGRSRDKKKGHRYSTKGNIGNRKTKGKSKRSVSPSSSDDLGSHGGSRGMSREKKKGHRDSTEGGIGNRENGSKSRSSLSPSRSYGSESIEKVTMESNPMRLKSVITVANLENEKDMTNDEVKEETVYDYDDYPSSKSNDSTELVDRFNSSDTKNEVKEVNSASNLNVSGNVGSEVDNLESILRQKALENLSRFRGGTKTKPADHVDDKPKSVQSDVKPSTNESVSTTPVTNRSRFTWRRDPSANMVKDEKAATCSEPHTSGIQPAELKLQSTNLSSTSRVDNNVDQKSTDVETQTPSSASTKEPSSKEKRNEGNDNSQFEKKTMSVMRGGEMVQVSYKVYIPNRAPALARRQLKR